MKKNIVFIATSIDGYIADNNGNIDWLHSIPNPDNIDMGYNKLMKNIDALIMGRNTFETVCSFDMDWPYTKKVFVLSNSLKEVPKGYKDKIELINGTLKEIVTCINNKGFYQLYIDGGKTIQSFLEEDLIDEMTITTIPIVLGGGIPLFNNLTKKLRFNAVETKLYLNSIVQTRFVRDKNH